MATMRAVREAYAARFNYDIDLLFRHARKRAKKYEGRIVKRQPKPVEEVSETLRPAASRPGSSPGA